MSYQAGFQLSQQQAHLWPLQQENLVANATSAILIKGKLDKEALENALQCVSQRHEILRTNFQRPPGMLLPYQVIAENRQPCFTYLELSATSQEEQAVKIEALLQAERTHRFDLAHGSLLRFTAATLATEQHLLVMTLPLLCADAWSFKLLWHEILTLYRNPGHEPTRAAGPVQYADYADWQQELLENQDEQALAGKEFWRKQISASAFSPRLAFESTANTAQHYETAAVSVALDPVLIAQADKTMASCDVSLSAIFLAGWQTLLWRLTGQSDLAIGVVLDGRPYAELHSGVGLFAQCVPLLGQMNPAMAFRLLLNQTEKAYQQAQKQQEYFSWAALADQLEEKLSPHCPFGFEFDNGSDSPLLNELALSAYCQSLVYERFKLKLTCIRTPQTVTAAIEYDTTLFAQEDIQRLTDQFQLLLNSALQAPETPVDRLAILPPAERTRLLVEFNATARDYPTDRCIHQLFEAQVARTPQQIALRCEEQTLTYGALNERANQIAHCLRQQQVGPDVVVGLCTERGLEMIVGLLAILKAGGAYVPLDPSLPLSRLETMLEDSGATVVLTQSHLAASLPQTVLLIHVDREWNGSSAEEAVQNVCSGATAKNLAYVIFTSGSTGRPKGVAVEHRQLANYVHAIHAALELPAAASVATVSTLSADLGNTAIFPALCTGGTLVVIGQRLISDPEALAAYFRRVPVDCLKITPPHLKALLACSTPEQILPRQRLVLGGEASDWTLIAQIQKLAPACQIFNHYGPTETTIGVLTYPVSKQSVMPPTSKVPIGRPLANTQLYLLDQYQNPVPIGATGELYIGGANVARGYLNRPALTEERFVPNPFVVNPSSRLYRTGDLVRYLADGTVEFLGRADNQVKIRGFRVELGEVEATLSQHPLVSEVTVTLVEEGASGPRLVAYVVPTEQSPGMADVLRAYMLEKLPNYMAPAAFVFLKNLPLTANGKVDRKALPAPSEQVGQGQHARFVPPCTPTEIQLVQLWEELLNVRPISIQDDFFALGGHSLMAVRLMMGIQHEFGVNLPPAVLFDSPSIEQLAALLQQHQHASLAWSPLVAIQKQGAKPPFFCVHGVGGHVLNYYKLAQALGPKQPFYGLQAIGLDAMTAPPTSVEQMAAHYLAAMLAVQPQGPYYLGGHSFGGQVAFEMARQLTQRGETVALLALIDSYAPGQYTRLGATWDDATWVMAVATYFAEQFGRSFDLSLEALQPLPFDAQLDKLGEQLKQAHLLPATADIAQIRAAVQVFKTNQQMVYCPTEKLSIPTVLFRASEATGMEPALQKSQTLGWDAWLQAPAEVLLLSGDHFTILAEPHVQTLAQQLAVCLAGLATPTLQRIREASDYSRGR